MATTSTTRIATLDIVRGVAVMGILAMNIVAFAMPMQAYFNPIAYGADSAIDMAAYAFNFILVDGKMRGLFSFLFGASMLLVAQRAEAKGESAVSITYRRLVWLLLFGLIHYYFIWFGDILAGYAMVGMVAWLFRGKGADSLIRWGIAFVTIQLMISGGLAVLAHSLAAAVAGPNPTPEAIAGWRSLSSEFAPLEGEALRQNLALYLGPWWGVAEYQLQEKTWSPFIFTGFFGWETLGYMLFGMAALKSGFLTGDWAEKRYERMALIGFGIAIPFYAVLALLLFADGFTVPGILTFSMAATIPVRPLMVLAYAALIIDLTRHGGWLVDRIAAAGRAAFTNYLGTSIVMTGIFYGWGFGLYGSVGRATLWLFVIGAWIIMLAWSKPWLERFRYGPFEWLWRSLARWQLQPMRRRVAASAVAGA